MPLIQCPDCSTEVSDQAASCPKCARPFGQSVANLSRGPVQTVEQTGRKWKLRYAVFGSMTIIGMIIFMAGDGSPIGAGLGAIGLLGYMVTRIGAWWQHG